MKVRVVAMIAALLVSQAASAPANRVPAARSSPPKLGDLGKVGSIRLPTSCNRTVQKNFERGVALLHSFFYEEARRIFTAAAEEDPACAMAHWGIAMTWWHPIWTPPTAEEMKAGAAAAERAKALGGKTDIERGLIAAIAAFYATPAQAAATAAGGQSCHGPTGGEHRGRALAFEKAMEKLFAQHPEDIEVATFYALALLGTTPPGDPKLENPRRATSILERFWRTQRDHPGLAHYLIHGYDYPPLAEQGLPAAKAYAKIAPWVPHVQHMPSHIFTRLGMWSEVIESNLSSAEAARQYAATHHPDATSFEELHALDYLVYGYLQTAQDGKARAVAQQVGGVQKTHPEVDFVVAYAAGAIPARYALERRQWSEAAALRVPHAIFWTRFPFAEGHLEFARALGAARTGKIADAKKSIGRLELLAAAIKDPRFEYFAKQSRMQIQAVAGFVAAAEGRAEQAERLLREAADTDDRLGKHPVSPGSLLPARELLADFLFERGKHAAALVEYEACLKLNPRRFNSLYGAGRAAELASHTDRARHYYSELLAVAAADAKRPELDRARAYLGSQATARPD